MSIENDIKQKIFPSEAIKLSINILFTASWLSHHLKQNLDQFNISWQQFNILRILRGAKKEPLALKTITDRMIDKTSNTSRLVDKLFSKGLVNRVTCPEDRRKVNIEITDRGLDVVGKASEIVENNTHTLFSSLSVEESQRANQLLDQLRLEI